MNRTGAGFRLNLFFERNGNIRESCGNPIRINRSIQPLSCRSGRVADLRPSEPSGKGAVAATRQDGISERVIRCRSGDRGHGSGSRTSSGYHDNRCSAARRSGPSVPPAPEGSCSGFRQLQVRAPGFRHAHSGETSDTPFLHGNTGGIIMMTPYAAPQYRTAAPRKNPSVCLAAMHKMQGLMVNESLTEHLVTDCGWQGPRAGLSCRP